MNMDILKQAEAKNLIAFDEERKFITYVHQNKKRNFQHSEAASAMVIHCTAVDTHI
ncbi:MAG: hypothetical protein MUC29_08770 [Pyrinomonadaceae bacterium]|nr:hypothetical protein [Pyrinomonadaceae bacterium]